MQVVANDASGSVAESTVKVPKKERGLLKPRRRRKGEQRHALDPYGTSQAADNANRQWEMGEIAAVSMGPAAASSEAVAAAGLADLLGDDGLKLAPTSTADPSTGILADRSFLPKRGANSTGNKDGVVKAAAATGEGKALNVSKQRSHVKGGAGIKDAVPAHLRGQVPSSLVTSSSSSRK